MKQIAKQKLFEENGAELKDCDLRRKQRLIAEAYIAGMKGSPCTYEGEFARSWEAGRREAEMRGPGFRQSAGGAS